MKLPKLNYYNTEEWILNQCINKNVLHLGCAGDITLKHGKDASLHYKLADISKVLWGVELDTKALDLIKTFIPETLDERIKYFNANIEDLNKIPDKKFDVILLGSIIEHLSNPGIMLNQITKFFHNDSILLITTPHVWGVLQFLRVVFKKNEAVNPEHTCWYSIPTLTELTSRYNLIPIEFNTGYGFHPNTRSWRIKKILGKIFFKIFPHLGGSLLVSLKLNNNENN